MWQYISIESVRKLFDDPSRLRLVPDLVVRSTRRGLFERAMALNRRWYERAVDENSMDVIEEDWDLLIILDAARPDMLADTSLRPAADSVETRVSPGSYSLQFLEESFADRLLHDTVYVSANPYTSKLPHGTFHAVENLHTDAWDEDVMTIRPEVVADRGIRAAGRYPNKRLIVHFMQPHFPFLGECGQQVDAGIGEELGGDGSHPWHDAWWGGADPDTVVEAFRENHYVVVPHVRRLLDAVVGRAIVTADHTNLIGERGFPIPIRQFGHPVDYPHPVLRTVPWYEFDGQRRDVVAEEPVGADNTPDENLVEDRLATLGYLE